jgi:hypothetical protein
VWNAERIEGILPTGRTRPLLVSCVLAGTEAEEALGTAAERQTMVIKALGLPEVTEAARIYAYDLITQNPDRRADNPNCGSYNGRLVAYDFEMAFSFLYAIPGTAGEPWEVARLVFAGQQSSVSDCPDPFSDRSLIGGRFVKQSPD